MLTIGYIGNGRSANRYHLPFVLERKSKINVKRIFDVDLSIDLWERVPNVEYTENVNDIMHDEEIDLVVICTRHDLHYNYAKQALENGKHCLVEKPFMETVEEAKEIFELAEEKNLIVQTYQNRRFDSDFLTVQKVIESGKLGEVYEIEMGFDYYRPEVPESIKEFNPAFSFWYGHGVHTVDQVISYFGQPDDVHYDVRQLLGSGRFNDYFDVDLYYENLKVSIRSSYFRVKPRPSFVVYGRNGQFVKENKDRQEEHLKLFYMPSNDDFGVDKPEHYGTLTYYQDDQYHEEKVVSEVGDYGRVYDDLYNVIVHGAEKVITNEQTLTMMQILEEGIKDLK